MFKRILSLMIAVMMLASFMVVTASAADKTSVYGANVTAEAGETVTVSFNIANNTGYNAAKMTVSVAAPLEIVDITKGQMTGNVNVGKGIINHASDAVDGVVAGNGTLFTVTVKVAEDAAANTYPVNVAVSFLTLADVSLDYTVAAGSVTIKGEPAPEHKCEFKPVETVEPTCTEAGYVLHKCECGETMKENLPALGHKFGTGYKYDLQNHWHLCERETADGVCGAESEHEKHKFTQNGNTFSCFCGYSYVDNSGEPPAGDITTAVTFGTVAMISMAAAAAYVASRKFAK